jgi:hypothetical protein
MEGESNKFSVISEIYAQFTEKNKEKLIKTALNLLKVQKEDAERAANAPPSQNEGGKEKLV